MRIPARRAVLAVASAVAATLLVSGGAAASLGAPASTGSPAGPAAPAGPGALASPGAPANYVFVHDPSMAREGGSYYLFSTGDPAGTIGNGNIQIRTSPDLRHWTYTGTVFADKPAWITAALGSIPNLWAPDISYFGGLWHLYRRRAGVPLQHRRRLQRDRPVAGQRAVREQVAGVRVVLERRQAVPAGRLDREAGQRLADPVLTGPATRAGRARRRRHHLPRRVLLPVRVVRHVLRGHRQHLPHHGGPFGQRHRTLRGSGRHVDDGQRRHGGPGQ
jgi:hypothetical protein